MTSYATAWTGPHHAPVEQALDGASFLRKLQIFLASHGWELKLLTVSMLKVTPSGKLELARRDGRLLVVSFDSLGRIELETYHREIHYSKGERRPTDVYLGRTHARGLSGLLRQVTAYITDNSHVPVARLALRRMAMQAARGLQAGYGGHHD